MNRGILRLSLIVCGLMLLQQCVSVRDIKTNNAPGFSIANYKTFDFYQLDVSGEEIPGFQQRIDWIKEEIVKQLKAKGLTQSSDSPDLLVNIGIRVEEKIQTRETDIRTDAPRYMGQRNYSWQSQEIEVGRYKDGTIKVDLVDRAKNEMVWSGSAASVIEKKDEASRKNIAAGGERMFAKMN